MGRFRDRKGGSGNDRIPMDSSGILQHFIKD